MYKVYPYLKLTALGGASVKTKLTSFAALTICVLLLASGAFAGSIPVANYSFETLPSGGLNNSCGSGCSWSTNMPIPGWVTTNDYQTGQWEPNYGCCNGAHAYDGVTLAYTNGGTISQNVATAVAGQYYTLQVEIYHRADGYPMAGVAQLTLNGIGVVATATGTDNGPGTWNLFTAHFTPTAAENGHTLGILLSANGAQGDFDDVRMNVPEHSTLATLLGFGI